MGDLCSPPVQCQILTIIKIWGRLPIMSFASFFRGHIFDDNINVCTANFAANGTSQEIPCYQLSILTFRYILLLKLPNAWQIVWGGETFCCIHLFLLRDLTNSLTQAAAGGWLKISRVRSSHCSVGSFQRLPEVSGGLRSHYLKDGTGVRIIGSVSILLLFRFIFCLPWIY